MAASIIIIAYKYKIKNWKVYFIFMGLVSLGVIGFIFTIVKSNMIWGGEEKLDWNYTGTQSLKITSIIYWLQTFQPAIVIYRKGNFVSHYGGWT